MYEQLRDRKGETCTLISCPPPPLFAKGGGGARNLGRRGCFLAGVLQEEIGSPSQGKGNGGPRLDSEETLVKLDAQCSVIEGSQNHDMTKKIVVFHSIASKIFAILLEVLKVFFFF